MHLALPSGLREVPRRWWVMSLVVLVALAAGGWTWRSRGDAATTRQITATVASGTFQTTVSTTGTITPERQADLTFDSSGTVTQVAVAAGDKVRKGDLLARIDTTSLQAQLAAAQAQLSAAQAQLTEDASSSSSQRASDSAAVASAQSNLDQAQDALDAATMRAPFSGTVSAVGFAVGDQVGSGSSGSGSGSGSGSSSGSSASTTAITLISPHALEVDADVSASEVTTLKKGMQAQITPTGGGETAYGTVADIGVIASASDSGAAQFPVTIAVTGKPTGLYAGSTATVSITVKQATNVLAVSTGALHMDGDKTYVYLVDGSKRTKRYVQVGQAYGMQTQIVSGLKAGDVVELASFTAPRTSGNGNRSRNGGTDEFRSPEGGFGSGFSGGGFSGGGFSGGGSAQFQQGG